MSVLFMDSFDHYTDLTQKWDTAKYAEIVDGGGRVGSAGVHLYYGSGSSQGYIEKTFTAGANWTVGMAWSAQNIKNFNVADNQVMEVRSGTPPATQQRVAISIRSDGYFGLLIGTGTVSSAVSIKQFDLNKFYYLELSVYVNNGAGSAQLLVNGSRWIYATGLNTDPFGTGTMNTIRIQAGGEPYVDDVYISNDLSPLNDIRVARLMPDGDSIYTEWTPSTGTTHYNLVNEAQPVTSTYVSSTGSQRDLYTFDDFEHSTGTALAVQLNYLTAVADIGSVVCAGLMRRSNDYVTSSFNVSGTTHRYRTVLLQNDPFTNSTWQTDNINTDKFGIETT